MSSGDLWRRNILHRFNNGSFLLRVNLNSWAFIWAIIWLLSAVVNIWPDMASNGSIWPQSTFNSHAGGVRYCLQNEIFFCVTDFFAWMLISKMGVKMNARIITKHHEVDPEIGFLTKSISKPYGRATAMPPAWEQIFDSQIKLLIH